ncbi:hypothetical protein QWJ90_01220 [Microbacterium oryzae]|uniref:hypothetical protein n=1 Tax=Microbacterium oryzae TaxID=743009 RepID=UPI0025B122CC|nr:hypothetical protein [Microbacterium oryzae]MDN3309542.1 hypothetical protein [Microbacterium oryzae]
MARKGDRHKNAKKASKLLATQPIEALYEAPSGFDVEEITIPVDLICGCRIVQRDCYQNHLLVQFAIMWITRDALGRWVEQYSCDSQHGYFHEHLTGHRKNDDRRNISALRSQVDVQECFDRAYDLVHDRHDNYCRGGWR